VFCLGNLRKRGKLKVPRRRKKDNIKLYGKVGMDKIDLAQGMGRWRSPA